jgi:hypothetical protein
MRRKPQDGGERGQRTASCRKYCKIIELLPILIVSGNRCCHEKASNPGWRKAAGNRLLCVNVGFFLKKNKCVALKLYLCIPNNRNQE